MTLLPEYQSKTKRRKLRGYIRNLLGTSTDPAPSIGALVRATNGLNMLMRRTTNWRWGVAIVSAQDNYAPIPREEIERESATWRED